MGCDDYLIRMFFQEQIARCYYLSCILCELTEEDTQELQEAMATRRGVMIT